MVHTCVSYKCGNVYGDVKETEFGEVKVRFYRFAKLGTDKCKKWMLATRLLNLNEETLEFTYLCDEHFTPNDYNNPLDHNSRLKKDAVPSVFVFPQHLQPVEKKRQSPTKRPFPVEDTGEGQVEKQNSGEEKNLRRN